MLTDEGAQGPSGVFLDALRARRAGVLQALEKSESGAPMAGLVFGLLHHVAQNPHARLDANLFAQLCVDRELDAEKVLLPLSGGPRVFDVLTDVNRPPGATEMISALFALGFAARLEALNVVERRDFTLRVVSMLPAVERIGPFSLSDFVDVVCAEEDALRFWQIYVDRVATEISKRTRAPGKTGDPWLLSRLLRLHEQGPSPGRGGAWLALKLHVNRILQAGRHRWRFIRSLAEGCHDPRMLHYLCIAPAMVEDPEVLHVFLSRGNSKLVSCALFAMQLHSESRGVVERLLEHFRERPLPEVGDRLVEIYAQLHLLTHPAPALNRMATGIRELLRERIGEGSVEPLLGAIANDARALRQVVLLADLVEERDDLERPELRQLLERVVATFIQSFTPSGVDHFLNDSIFHGAVRRALGRLLAAGVPEVQRRLEDFGLDLDGSAAQWLKGERDDALERLLGRFLGVFAHTLVGVCRSLYNRSDAREQGLAAYRLLVRVYLAHFQIAPGTGWFGAMEYVLPATFPDLMEGEPQAERLDEAAQLVAKVEEELWPELDTRPADAPVVFSEEPLGLGPPTPTGEPLLAHTPRREHVVAEVELVSAVPGPAGSVLRAWLGLDLLREAGAGLMRFLGVRRHAQLTLSEREFILSAVTAAGETPIDTDARSHALSDLVAVRVRQRMRTFYLVCGLAMLVFCGLLGGHLLFAGLRAAESGTVVAGGALLAFGAVFDLALARIAARHRRFVLLELVCRSRPRPIRVLVHAEEGAHLLDAFMANDARRREMELLDSWSALDVAWEEEGAPEDAEGSLA